MSAFDNQVGGSHYKDMKIQPFAFMTSRQYSKTQGDLFQYVLRKKNNDDLEKAIHVCRLDREARDLDYDIEQFIKANEIPEKTAMILRLIDSIGDDSGVDYTSIIEWELHKDFVAPELPPEIDALRNKVECEDCD